MKALLLIFSLLFSFQALAETAAEKKEKQRRRDRAKYFKNTTFVSKGSENCDDATKVTKEIQRMVTEAKYSDAEGKNAKSISELEQEYEALRANQVLYSGLSKINKKYKGFLSSIAGVNGFKPMDGMDKDGQFSLDKLRKDLEASKQQIKDVETMAFMDHLLKDAIESHANLIDPGATKKAIEEDPINTPAQKDLGMPLIHNKSSGRSVYSQLENYCGQIQTKKLLCKVLKESTPEGKDQIKATVIGFVDAYKMSSRNGLQKALTSNFVRDDLVDYRKLLLKGIEGVTAEKLKNEIGEFKKGQADLEELSKSDPTKINGMISDLNEYQSCLAAEALSEDGEDKGCKLAKEVSIEYAKTLNKLAQVQHDVVEKLAGPNSSPDQKKNASIKARLNKIHNHITTKENLEQVQKLYEGEPEFKKQIKDKIKGEKLSIKTDIKGILGGVLAGNSKSKRELLMKDGSTPDAFKKFLTEKKNFKAKDKATNAADTSKILNETLAHALCTNKLPGSETPEEEACKEPGVKAQMLPFVAKNGEIDIDPTQLEEYLKELNEGDLDANTDKLLLDASTKMGEVKKQIDSIRKSNKFNTLNKLLSHYGNKAKNSCKGLADKEIYSCSRSNPDSNEKVSALVDHTGKILSTMPSSPGNLAITDLNNECDTKFMNGFSGNDAKLIGTICTAVQKENERYVESLKPTAAEIKDRTVYTYWNGTKRVSEGRQRNRWMVAQSIAEGGINFLPSYLDHKIKTTGIETWEASTIAGIQYRNGMLENYYTYGIYGNNGYFGGSPDYLSNWGGSVFNNGFQTTGAGGYFGFTQPAITPVTADASSGFSF